MNPLDILIGEQLASPDNLSPMVRGIQKKDTQHKGAFGMRGTIRDIVGYLGDMMVVAGGGKPYYRLKKEQEELGDAMVGWQQDPAAAIQRLTATGQTEAAMKLAEHISKARENEAQTRSATATATDKELDIEDKTLKNGLNFLRSVQDDPRGFEWGRKLVADYWREKGYTPRIPLPDSPDRLEHYIKSLSMTAAERALADDRVADNEETRRHHEVTEGISQGNLDARREADAETADYHDRTIPIREQEADAETIRATASIINANKPGGRGGKGGRIVREEGSGSPARTPSVKTLPTPDKLKEGTPAKLNGRILYVVKKINGKNRWVDVNTKQPVK